MADDINSQRKVTESLPAVRPERAPEAEDLESKVTLSGHSTLGRIMKGGGVAGGFLKRNVIDPTWRAVGYAIPILQSYDFRGEAYKVAEELSPTGVPLDSVIEATKAAYEENKGLYFLGKIADTGDRGISAIFGPIEAATSLASDTLAHGINVVEEVVEQGIKTPFYLSLMRKGQGQRAKMLGLIELCTAGLPAAGDLYDFATNKYVDTAKEVIRERAKQILYSRMKMVE